MSDNDVRPEFRSWVSSQVKGLADCDVTVVDMAAADRPDLAGARIGNSVASVLLVDDLETIIQTLYRLLDGCNEMIVKREEQGS